MVNIQTYDVRYTETMGKGTFEVQVNIILTNTVNVKIISVKFYLYSYAGRLEILSDQTDDIDDGMSDRLFLKTLRVFYVTKPSVKPPSQVSFVTSKLFLPVRTGERSFESMSQTMFRIEAWLKVTGVSLLLLVLCMIFPRIRIPKLWVNPPPNLKGTPMHDFFKKNHINLCVFIDLGIPVYSVETVRFLYREPLKLGVDDKRTNYTCFNGTGKHYVTAIRLCTKNSGLRQS